MSKDPKNTIAFQGIPGANSDLACRAAFPYHDTMACPSFEDVFNAVESGQAAIGMVPIENSQAGRVAEIHNLLPRVNLHIIGEYFQKIHHCLVAPKGAKKEDVKTVFSHPQALMQCRNYLNKMKVETVAHSNTAAAAADVAQWNDKSKAAISSRLAADLYGLDVIQQDIQDSNDNVSIFIGISKEPVDPDPKDGKILTSLMFSVRNIPAALYKGLGGFATNNINMLKLESYMPLGTAETAQFFMTIEGNPNDRPVQLALEELSFFCRKVRVLGVYLADPMRYA